MPKTDSLDLASGDHITILYEDRSVIAIDKPRNWMLVPPTWQNTPWNLQVAITSSIRAGDYWAKSRGLRYLQFVHRLDAATTGVLLFAKHPNAIRAYSALFESREVEKVYLAVVGTSPTKDSWLCHAPIGPMDDKWGRMQIDPRRGKPAETRFQVLARAPGRVLVEARPATGRTHQIRLHLREAGCPVLGDDLYGRGDADGVDLALRSVYLGYTDPFTRKRVRVEAESKGFLREYGFPEFSARS